MSIKQLNATYVPEEDRVLFRLTTHPSDEYRLWLTRARVAELLSLGERAAIVQLQAEHAHAPQQAKAIAEFKQQVVQQTTTFTQFEPATRLPLGAEPTLVKSLRFEQQESQQVLHLDLVGNKTLSLKLNEELLAKLRMLLTTIAGAGLISRGRLSLFYAALASISVLLEQIYEVLVYQESVAQFVQAGFLCIGFCFCICLCF